MLIGCFFKHTDSKPVYIEDNRGFYDHLAAHSRVLFVQKVDEFLSELRHATSGFGVENRSLSDRGHDRGEISVQRSVLVARIVARLGKRTRCVHANRQKRLIGGLDVALQLVLVQSKESQNQQSEQRIKRRLLFVVSAIGG